MRNELRYKTKDLDHIRKKLYEAADCVGSQAELMRRINDKHPNFHKWKIGYRPIPLQQAIDIELVTNSKVKIEDLIPSLMALPRLTGEVM